MPKARITDPHTSHEAADSVKNLTQTQMGILNVLTKLRRPAADEEIIYQYQIQVRLGLLPRASESGIRSRRSELVAYGKVVAAGLGRTASNRKTVLWGLADD